MKIISRIILIVFCFMVFSAIADAEEEKKGKLNSFEEAIEEPAPEHKTHHEHRHHEEAPAAGYAAQGLMDIFTQFFLAGAATAAAGGTEMMQELKTQESPALPAIRFEPGYQYVWDNVHGFAGSLEAGYLMFGADGEFLYYWEKAANDNMKIISGHFLLRTLFVNILQTNLAMGVKTYWGNDHHTGFDIGVPFYVFFTKHLIWDIKPFITVMSGRDVYDLSSGLSYKYKLFGVRGAYRVISVKGSTLHGPQIGVFIQW
jgi:hypothetical protein